MRLLPIALACCTLLSTPAHADPVPIKAFVDTGEFSEPSLSPDGKHIAVNVRLKRGERNVPTLMVYSLPDLKLVSTIGLKGFEMAYNYHWVSNRRLVAEKALEVGLKEVPQATGEVIAFDFDGTRFEYLYGYDMFHSSTKGERYGDDYGWADLNRVPLARNDHVYIDTHLWRASSSQVYDINTVTAARRLLGTLPERRFSFVLSDDGTPHFAHGVNDEDKLVVYRADGQGQWQKLESKALGGALRPYMIADDGNSVFSWFSVKGGPLSLVRFDLKTNAITPLSSFPDADAKVFLWSLGKRSDPLGVRQATGAPVNTYLAPNHPDAVLHKTLSAQFPGETVTFFNDTMDGSKVLFSVRSDRDPGAFYLFDRQTGNAQLLFTNSPLIDPDQMAERRPIRYKARDGLELEGFLTVPAHPAGSKLPLIVMPHGGPIGPRDTWFYDRDAQFLASRGYAVLQPNYRGSGGRGEAFRHAGYRQWGGKMMDDIVDGVKWAGTQEGIDIGRACTYGGSFGGYAALMLPIREPDMFKCAVGYAGVYDLAKIYDEKRVRAEKGVRAFYVKTIGEDKAELARFSPALQAEKIKLPVFLVHGEKDETCPIEQFEEMTDALVKAGRPPETMRVPKEGHGFFDEDNQAALLARLEQFFAKHLRK